MHLKEVVKKFPGITLNGKPLLIVVEELVPEERCTCEEESLMGIADHPCPFESEIHGHYGNYCNCCAYCKDNCAWNI